MVAQSSLEALVMVRIHVGQPRRDSFFQGKVLFSFARRTRADFFICVPRCSFVVQLACEHHEFEPGHGHRRERVAGGAGRTPHFARRGDASETRRARGDADVQQGEHA